MARVVTVCFPLVMSDPQVFPRLAVLLLQSLREYAHEHRQRQEWARHLHQFLPFNVVAGDRHDYFARRSGTR